MSLESIKTALKSKMAYAAAIDARIKLDFGDDGVLLIDATENPPSINSEDGEADVTLSCSLETFEALVEGTQDPTVAFMTGKLKVKGSMAVAMKLSALLEG